jgi:hypothetical protein
MAAMLSELPNSFFKRRFNVAPDAASYGLAGVVFYVLDPRRFRQAILVRRRRALIVVTNGEDRANYYKEAQLFQNLREQDVQIFVIGFVNVFQTKNLLYVGIGGLRDVEGYNRPN